VQRVMIAAALLATTVATGRAWAMGNPASAYCASLGGRVEIRREAAGEAGYCHLPDGRVVEEWQLFRAAKQR
jgi:putative hemolysin